MTLAGPDAANSGHRAGFGAMAAGVDGRRKPVKATNNILNMTIGSSFKSSGLNPFQS